MPSNQVLLPLSFGASLPSYFVGSPPSTIHGRVANFAELALSLSMGCIQPPRGEPMLGLVFGHMRALCSNRLP
jgi:hypothetical protein